MYNKTLKTKVLEFFKTRNKNLFTSQMISESDLNHTFFPKFKFSTAKFVYDRMQQFTNFEPHKRLENLKLFFLSPFGTLGTVFLVLIILCGIFIPFTTLSPYDSDATKCFLDFGSEGHILGTDKLGRDIWARTWWGLRNSLGIGFAAVAGDVFLGIFIGLIMGYYRLVDRVLNFVIKVLLTIPNIIILIFLTTIFRATVGTIILGILITGWIPMCLQIRSFVISLSNMDFVTSSKLLDTPNKSIIKDFIPYLLPTVFALLIQTIPSAIFADTALSVLGILVPNLPTLGSAIQTAISVISTFPQQIVGPIFIYVFLVFNVQMISVAIAEISRQSR